MTNEEKIGQAAMEAIERMSADFGPDVTIKNVMIVVEIDYPDPDDGEETSSCPYYCDNDRPTTHIGMLTMALLNAWSPKED